MTELTPEQHRRAVEVMAQAIYERSYKEWEPAWKQVPDSYRAPWILDAENALTALLTVADVTMKENKDG